MGKLLAYLYLLVRAGHGERLLVRIDSYKLDALSTGFHHPVDDVISGAAYADYFDRDHILGPALGFEIHIRASCIFFIPLDVRAAIIFFTHRCYFITFLVSGQYVFDYYVNKVLN